MTSPPLIPPLTSTQATAYLALLHQKPPLNPDFATLATLQSAHLETIPFENLSIVWGQPIILDENALFDKIIGARAGRGGFCYELNGLFSALLTALGYDVTRIQAQVYSDGRPGPPFDHMALIVTLPDGHYLVDVGFGDSARAPLRLPDGGASDVSGQYRLARASKLRLEKRDPDGWTPQFHFDLTPRNLAEYAPMCRFHQTSPDSSFTRRTIVTRATSDGRITLTADTLTITEEGHKTHTPIPPDDWPQTLLTHFAIQHP